MARARRLEFARSKASNMFRNIHCPDKNGFHLSEQTRENSCNLQMQGWQGDFWSQLSDGICSRKNDVETR